VDVANKSPNGGPEPSASLLLEGKGLSKAFGHVQAVRGINIDLREGEVLALVGDNGAGKSTLIKILSGALRPDSGELFMDGERVNFQNPIVARDHGIETVHQDLAIVPTLTVAENLFLGREVRFKGPIGRFVPFIDRRTMRRQAREHLRELNINIPSVRQRTDTLSGGQRQAVSVARAPAFGRRVVILDEPTAALGVRETAAVMEVIRRIKERGLAIILVSHNLPQVLDISSRVLVLRAGRRVGCLSTEETNMEQVVRMITGAESFDAA
jgi:fructose transport system ATP-binding protein